MNTAAKNIRNYRTRWAIIMDTAAKNKRNGQNKVSCHHGHCCQEQKECTEQGELSSWILLPRTSGTTDQGELSSWILLPRTSGTDRIRWAVIMDTAAKNKRNGQNKVSYHHGYCCQEHQERQNKVSYHHGYCCQEHQERQNKVSCRHIRSSWLELGLYQSQTWWCRLVPPLKTFCKEYVQLFPKNFLLEILTYELFKEGRSFWTYSILIRVNISCRRELIWSWLIITEVFQVKGFDAWTTGEEIWCHCSFKFICCSGNFSFSQNHQLARRPFYANFWRYHKSNVIQLLHKLDLRLYNHSLVYIWIQKSTVLEFWKRFNYFFTNGLFGYHWKFTILYLCYDVVLHIAVQCISQHEVKTLCIIYDAEWYNSAYPYTQILLFIHTDWELSIMSFIAGITVCSAESAQTYQSYFFAFLNFNISAKSNQFLQWHCKQDPIYVFPEMKLCGIVPTFMYLWAIGQPILLRKLLTDTWMWKLGTRPRSFISGNT